MFSCHVSSFFFFNHTATTEIYTLSLHDALPIWPRDVRADAPGPGPGGPAQRRVDLLQGHGFSPAAAGLPDPRRAESRDDRALRLPAAAPADRGPYVEGGQLLRSPLRARRGVVPRELPEHAARSWPRRRGEPELCLPPARARAGRGARAGGEADRARAQPGRPRVLALS